MGLSISIQTKIGDSATHWRVASVSIDNLNLQIRAMINGYLTQAAFDAGKDAIQFIPFAVNFRLIDPVTGVVSANPLYNQVLTDPSGVLIAIEKAAKVDATSALNGAVQVSDTAAKLS